MEKFFRLLFVLILGSSLLLLYLAFAYNGPRGTESTDGFLIALPFMDSIILFIKKIPLLKPLISSGTGLSPNGLYLAIVGFVIAMVFFKISLMFKKPPVEVKVTKSVVSNITTSGEVKKSKQIVVNEDILEDDDGDDDLFSNIERVIALSHSVLTAADKKMLIDRLRPEFLPYESMFSEEVTEIIAKQILNHFIVKNKRAQIGIAPAQFRLQDQKMNEIERETICRRFLPKNTAALTDEAKQSVGRILTVLYQAETQQSTMSQADDWVDMSLRNMVDIMSIEVPKAA